MEKKKADKRITKHKNRDKGKNKRIEENKE